MEALLKVHKLALDIANIRQSINLTWLIKLRWGASLGQFVAVIAAYYFLNVALHVSVLLGVVAMTVASNIAVYRWSMRHTPVSETLIGCVIGLDILLLTVLLYFTGGPQNPFNFLYLVYVALAAVTLSSVWLWALFFLSFVCFAWLFWFHLPLAINLGPPQDGLPLPLYRQGMAVAFPLAAMFIVYFVQRITAALRQKEAELAMAQQISARNEKLTSLATLAAGAAHELATPLATIAVIAKELERELGQCGIDGTLFAGPIRDNAMEDARLIRQEVSRCRKVLTQMAADAGASSGEPFMEVTPAQLIAQSIEDMAAADRLHLDETVQHTETLLFIPSRSIAQGLRAVIKNALEATNQHGRVDIRVSLEKKFCVIVVCDTGSGMPKEILSRISEPFFTTKGPGAGMGLGLFLTRTVLERLGGCLEVSSFVDSGTVVVMRLPLQSVS